jgi:hypothetical protein
MTVNSGECYYDGETKSSAKIVDGESGWAKITGWISKDCSGVSGTFYVKLGLCMPDGAGGSSKVSVSATYL